MAWTAGPVRARAERAGRTRSLSRVIPSQFAQVGWRTAVLLDQTNHGVLDLGGLGKLLPIEGPAKQGDTSLRADLAISSCRPASAYTTAGDDPAGARARPMDMVLPSGPGMSSGIPRRSA